MAELKPCPFCGGKAKTGHYYPCDGYQGESAVYKIECKNCHAKIESDSIDSVWDLWNTRTPKERGGEK